MWVAKCRGKKIGMVLAGLLGGSLTAPAWPDTILLTNGDRLTGNVQSMDGQALILETDYAGEIRIDWEKVKKLRIDNPMLLEAKNLPADYLGRLEIASQPGRLATAVPAEAAEPSREVALADIQRIARPDPYAGRWHFEGELDVALDATHASSSNQNWSAATHVIARRDWWRHRLNLDYTRKTQDGVVGTYNYNAAYTADRFLSDKLFLRGRIRYGRDRIDNPATQWVFAAGAGYQFWDGDMGAFSVSALATHTRYRYHDNTHDNFPSAGIGWDFTQYLGGKQWQVFSVGDVQHVLRNESDYSVETELGLRYRVTQWMSLYAKAAYQRIAIVGQTPTNERRYSLGLGVHW